MSGRQVGAPFDFVCEVEPERGLEGTIQIFKPQARYKKRDSIPLHKHGHGPFCRFKIPKDKKVPGVYALTVDGEVVYVGECENLSQRFNAGYGNISPKNCYVGGQRTNCKINNLILTTTQAGRRVQLWFFGTSDHKKIEKRLLEEFNPRWNGRG